MDLKEKLDQIPRGNTCKGVNRLVIERLISELPDNARRFLDVPCGDGEFLDTVTEIFPDVETTGADLNKPAVGFKHGFIPFNGERPEGVSGKRFDVVTCISGVMEFDNTLLFFEHVRAVLAEDGIFIVTNDNLLSVKDRLSYLFLGRFGQYAFETDTDRPTWKILPAQNLLRLLDQAGFVVTRFEYVPVVGANWMWMFLALPLWLIRNLGGSDPNKQRVFNLRSFLSRHYVVACRPRSSG